MLPDDDDADDDMLEEEEESSDLEHDPAISALFPDDEDEQYCDMCGISAMEIIDFSDGNGYVCEDCHENITADPPQDAAPSEHAAPAQLVEPETEPDPVEPSSDPEPEPDEFASNSAKRRRLNE